MKKILVLFAVSTSVWFAAFDQIMRSEPVQSIQHSYDTKIRSMLGMDPEIHKNLYIIGFDDATATYTNEDYPSIDSLVTLIKTAVGRGFQSIFIDTSFRRWYSAEEIQRFHFEVDPLPITLIGMGSVHKFNMHGRPLASLNRPEFQASRYNNLGLDENQSRFFMQAPKGKLDQTFTVMGHGLSNPENYSWPPFVKIGDHHLAPAIQLLLDNSTHVKDGKIMTNGAEVPVNEDGKVLMNPVDEGKIMASMEPMHFYLTAKKLKKVEPGSIAIVTMVDHFGTRFADTPAGSMPTGFIHVSNFNNVLTQSWITPLSSSWIMVLVAIFSIIMALLDTKIFGIPKGKSPSMFVHEQSLSKRILAPVALTFLAILINIGIASLMFTHKGILIPWIATSIAFGGFMLAKIGFRWVVESNRIAEDKATSGLLNAEQSYGMNKILGDRQNKLIEGTTLVFDIPKSTSIKLDFEIKSKFFVEIIDMVNQRGGIPIKLTGDGILFLFLKDYAGDHYAEDALSTAVHIQKYIVERYSKVYREFLTSTTKMDLFETGRLYGLDSPQYKSKEKSLRDDLRNYAHQKALPLRAGLSTGEINLYRVIDQEGKIRGLDVHGTAVDRTFRVEQASEPLKVAICKDTYRAIGKISYECHLKNSELKGMTDDIVYNVDPFQRLDTAYAGAFKVYRMLYDLWEVEEHKQAEGELPAYSMESKWIIDNYSLGGFRLLAPEFHGPGNKITLEIPDIEETVMVEITRSNTIDSSTVQMYAHGAKIIAPEEEKEVIKRKIVDFFSNEDRARRISNYSEIFPSPKSRNLRVVSN